MNYITEDNIDFFDEITNLEDEDEDEKEVDKWLLSGTPLTRNHITLDCNHKFNYCPLFHEVVKQKTVYNPNETSRLMIHEIKCPYCRQITPNLLPYIPVECGIIQVKGVNYPKNYCLQHKRCMWCFKTGKRKGQYCRGNGFETVLGTYCNKHWENINSKTQKSKDENNEEWTTEMEGIYKSYTVASLKNLLRHNNIKVSGLKKNLVIRVVTHDLKF
tara:strand:+ start:1097 stop:1744 length:648 start_codon:yes stop_codon:yes gene_type:complete